MINRVVPDAELADVSLKIATSLAEGPTAALGMIRRLGWAATTYSFEELLALEEALQELERLEPRQAMLVESRFFGGLDVMETAELLDVSEATVNREWRAAKAWLKVRLKDQAH